MIHLQYTWLAWLITGHMKWCMSLKTGVLQFVRYFCVLSPNWVWSSSLDTPTNSHGPGFGGATRVYPHFPIFWKIRLWIFIRVWRYIFGTFWGTPGYTMSPYCPVKILLHVWRPNKSVGFGVLPVLFSTWDFFFVLNYDRRFSTKVVKHEETHVVPVLIPLPPNLISTVLPLFLVNMYYR